MSDVALVTAESVGESRKRVATTDSVRRFGGRRWLWRLLVTANVLGLILLATLLRCRDLGNLPGINGDEAWYGVQAELCLRGEPIPWRTPSGNLLNPLFFGPQLAMHALFGPSFALLRATAVVSGMLALAMNFWLCRRVLGQKIAFVSTLVLAVLPIDIAYSRFAWDASQSLLVTLPCVYLPLWTIVEPRLKVHCSAAAVAALALAIVVHPTNLFVAPIAIACLGYAWREELRRMGRRIADGYVLHRRIAMAAGIAAAVALAVAAASAPRPAWIGPAFARIANPSQYAEFTANLGRLFSGATVYEYLSGSLTPPASSTTGGGGFRWDCLPYDVAAWIVAGWLTWGLVHAMRRHRPELVCLAVGWVASLFGFFLVAGPGALAPQFERYAIWIVAPTAILASISIVAWQTQSGRVGRLFTILAIAQGWTLLFGFQTNCLDFMRQTGGRAHQTFRTAAVEPKQAALAYILAQREPQQSVRIVTSQWWIYWPMRYLSLSPRLRDAESPVTVVLQPVAKSTAPLAMPADSERGRSWLVEFTDSADCKAVRQAAHQDGLLLRETTIDDFSGRPLLSLFAVGSTKLVPEKVLEPLAKPPGTVPFSEAVL